MKFAKVPLYLAAILVAFGTQAQGAVAYINFPPAPPFYNPNQGNGSSIFGPIQDPQEMNRTGVVAMSFVPTVSGNISAVTLAISLGNANADGRVDVFLAQNPFVPDPIGNPGAYNFMSTIPLGNATTTALPGDDTTLTSVTLTNLTQGIISGQTYYLLLEPGAGPNYANVGVVWNGNITGAMSDFYGSTNAGATFSHGGVFNSDGLEVDVDVTAIPEPSTWVGGAMMFGAIGLLGSRRLRRAKS